MKDIKTSHAYGFSILMAGSRLLHFIRWVEIYYERETTEAISTSLQNIIEKFLSFIVFSIASIFSNTSYVGNISSNIALCFWGLSFLIERFTALMLFIPFMRLHCLPKSRRIPMHIPYTLHRCVCVLLYILYVLNLSYFIFFICLNIFKILFKSHVCMHTSYINITCYLHIPI